MKAHIRVLIRSVAVDVMRAEHESLERSILQAGFFIQLMHTTAGLAFCIS